MTPNPNSKKSAPRDRNLIPRLAQPLSSFRQLLSFTGASHATLHHRPSKLRLARCCFKHFASHKPLAEIEPFQNSHGDQYQTSCITPQISLSRRITVQGRRSHGDVGHRRAALPHLACLLENAGAAATARAIERRRSRWGQRSIELCDTHRQIAVDGQLWLFWAGRRMKYKHMSRTNTCLRGQWFTPAKPQKRKQVDYACHATKR